MIIIKINLIGFDSYLKKLKLLYNYIYFFNVMATRYRNIPRPKEKNCLEELQNTNNLYEYINVIVIV